MSTSTDKRFDAFIFDLDGTLLDTLPDLVLLANMILEELGYPKRSEAEILSYVGNGVRRLMYQALPPEASEADAECAMKLWNENFQKYYKHTHPYAGIVDTLEELRLHGYKIGVVSNKLQAGVDMIVNTCLPGLVDIMIGEREGIPRKPDPKGLLMAISNLGTTPDRTIYIGDSPGDIHAARNAGAFSAGVTWGYHESPDFAAENAVPNMLIDKPEELLTLI